MITLITLLKFGFFHLWGWLVIVVAVAVSAFLLIKKYYKLEFAFLAMFAVLGLALILFGPRVIPSAFEYPLFLQTFGPANGPALPFKSALAFLKNYGRMEKVENIAADPADLPPPIQRSWPETVKINLTAKEVVAEMAPGALFNYWTFDGQVPGPFLRVREGDTVELTLANDPTSLHTHNIDLHAVNGPGGGAALTNVGPGETKTLTFKAINPGIYMYHCAHPNVATHDAHGMYGLILVEPKGGLSAVDKEFYVMQGEFYSVDPIGSKGLQIFDAKKMLDGKPEYVVFNGKTSSLTGNLKAEVGDKVRIFIGNGGVNLHSAFHVIGEIFDTVYPEGSIGGSLLKNVQTTLIPAGGAAIVDFKLEVPGNYILVDHALSRVDRGAWGVLEVGGKKNPELFAGADSHSHSH